MQPVPTVDGDGAVEGIDDDGGRIRCPARGGISELEGRTMLGHAADPLPGWGRPAKDPVCRQSGQDVHPQIRRDQLPHRIAATQQQEGARSIRPGGGAGSLHRAHLGDGQRGRGARGGAAPIHGERQDPTARVLRHGHQPLILPAIDHGVSGRAGGEHAAGGALRAGRGAGSCPTGAVQRPHFPVRHGGRHDGQVRGEDALDGRHLEGAITEGITRRCPAARKAGCQAESYQALHLWRRHHRVQQVEECVAPHPETLIQCVAKARQGGGGRSGVHPSTISPRRAFVSPHQPFVQTPVRMTPEMARWSETTVAGRSTQGEAWE